MVSMLDVAPAPVAKLLQAANANDTEAFLAWRMDQHREAGVRSTNVPIAERASPRRGVARVGY